MCRSPVLPLFARELGASPATVGLVVAASTLTGVVLKFPAGALSDVLGRRAVLLTAAVVFAHPACVVSRRGWPVPARGHSRDSWERDGPLRPNGLGHALRSRTARPARAMARRVLDGTGGWSSARARRRGRSRRRSRFLAGLRRQRRAGPARPRARQPVAEDDGAGVNRWPLATPARGRPGCRGGHAGARHEPGAGRPVLHQWDAQRVSSAVRARRVELCSLVDRLAVRRADRRHARSRVRFLASFPTASAGVR